MLVMGCVFGCVDVVLTVAASLSVQSPFTNRSFRELDVVRKRERLASPLGDPFTLINIFRLVSFLFLSEVTHETVHEESIKSFHFREWVLEKATRGGGRRWTIENGIDEFRLFEISKLRNQYKFVAVMLSQAFVL